MRSLFGFSLLLIGFAFGIFAYFPDSVDREARLAEVTAIIAAPLGDVTRSAPDTTGSVRTFAPAQPLTIRQTAQSGSPAPLPGTSTQPSSTQPSMTTTANAPAGAAAVPGGQTGAALVARAPSAEPPAASTGWQAIVTSEQGAVPAGVTSTKPGDGHARYELVMNIQRELKRAGCYGGSVTGSWTASTKRAMAAFQERVNSRLPADEPDYILLTLLKGSADSACSTCPIGQTLSGGRCMPKAVIAQTNGSQTNGSQTNRNQAKTATGVKPTPAENRFTTTVAGAEPVYIESSPSTRTSLPGRMAIGGPSVERAPAAATTAPAVDPWQIKVLSAPKAAPASLMPTPVTAPSRTAALSEPAQENEQAAAVLPGPAEELGSPAATQSGPAVPAPVYAAPKPRPRVVARPRPSNSARPQRVRSPTRSVQNLFMHPLGRM